MSSVARNTPGCRFLVRMVAEGGAAAAQQVLHEVAGDVVRLMVHADGHALVEALVQYLTDEQMARVLEILDAASPLRSSPLLETIKGKAYFRLLDHLKICSCCWIDLSNILQTLIGRIAGNPGHAEFFTRTLARVGERGVLSLMEDMDGSRLIMRCLDTFSAAHNQFITVAMAMSLHRMCRDRHGCHVMIKCIDMAGVDAQMWSSLVHAVCWDGFALAEHAYGPSDDHRSGRPPFINCVFDHRPVWHRNYVVQHVLRCVTQARAALHAAFRSRYVSLSTQMASIHVVQRCLELFSPEQADEIVGELLGCHRHHWAGCTFQQLISDRFANFVLQYGTHRGQDTSNQCIY
ncbi:putative pumilio homolog 7, chloroplastic [Miscanthus floridulus]|uniref:putative pumilio homolog 7, chloroplastic n=1 Tax=Miscanthus floridulus TaxID=154761 RepID=UPI00345A1361